MAWLYFLLAAVAFALAFRTTSVALLVVCLLAGLGLLLAGVLKLLADRIGQRSRGDGPALDPDELRRLREEAEARKLATGQNAPVQNTEPPPHR